MKAVREERLKGKDGDVKGATLSLQRAQLELVRAQTAVSDAQAEQNDVLRSGEEGSEKVKGALGLETTPNSSSNPNRYMLCVVSRVSIARSALKWVGPRGSTTAGM